MDVLEPLRERYAAQHHALRKFYFECSNLKYLTGLINVPKLGQEPPDLLNNGSAPDLPARPSTNVQKSPGSSSSPTPDAATISEQARILKEYEDKQAQLKLQAAEEERRRQELEAQQQREFEARQRQQQEQERLALEQLQQQQLQQYTNAAAARVNDLEREIIAMRGQYERDQLLLEQYDRVSLAVLLFVFVVADYRIEGQGSGG